MRDDACEPVRRAKALIDKLEAERTLSVAEYRMVIEAENDALSAYAAQKADAVRRRVYGTDVYLRGLIEVTNVCRNDCYYCGIRRSDKACVRYTLSDEEILSCCENGYALGFRTFVLQGGEGTFSAEHTARIVSDIKKRYPDCAVTLSLGEYEKDEYKIMFDSGADRYLLRHETANKAHYGRLHPKEMSFEHRMKCLCDLREIGFAVGCGFMVGSPYQTAENLAEDLKFVEEFSPEMCGIGPFLPQKDTPFGKEKPGSAETTIFLLSLLRLIKPTLLLPATTALGTALPDGRERGLCAGANVVMPNLSPVAVRKHYNLYDNKICTGEEAAECRGCLARRIESVGYRTVISRGDPAKNVESAVETIAETAERRI